MHAIGKGAEAYVYEDKGSVIKVRQPKKYRQPELDERLRKSRTRKEASAIAKCNAAGIPSPKLLSANDYSIAMEFVEGKRVHELLQHATPEKKEEYAERMGELLAKLHNKDICHGDYSPTNLIERKGVLHIIDFGLCEFSNYHEKKAADLAVMHSALKDEELFAHFRKSYSKNYPDCEKVLERFDKNQLRGRYKER